MPCTCAISCMAAARDLLERREIGADDLRRIGAFDARQSFLDIVLDILREIEIDADEFLVKFGLQLVDQRLLGHIRRPLVERLQRHEKLGIVESRRVAAVVRAALLRGHGDDFGILQQNFADLGDDRLAGFQRNRRRHRGADPQIALFERRQEFAAEPRAEKAADDEEDQSDRDRDPPVRERPAQHRRIDRAQPAHDDGLDFRDAFRKQQRGEARRHREGRDQRADQRISVGPRHRAENLAFDALHGEQRNESRDDDRGGEKHRAVDLQRADQNEPQPVVPQFKARRNRCRASDRRPIGLRRVASTARRLPAAAPGNSDRCFPPE